VAHIARSALQSTAVKVLVIGGNRFVGLELVTRLLLDGHEVTTLNRGQGEAPFGHRVHRIVCDRESREFETVFESRFFDAVVDFALFNENQAQRTVQALEGKCAHYVLVSTGQVYLVKQQVPSLALEQDFEGPVAPKPTGCFDIDQWQYGIGKRGAEEVIAASALPSTRMRIPMVHGLRDYKRRLESLLWRFLDGAPILLTNENAPCRHVFSNDVVRALMVLLKSGPTHEAFHVSQDQTLTAKELVLSVARIAGARNQVLEVHTDDLATAGIDPNLACSFNSSWMSVLSPKKIENAFQFRPREVEENLRFTVEALLAKMAVPPPSMVQRPLEVEFSMGGLVQSNN
jgi:nucleoside-diphosphate-sugar epimerase